MVDQDARRGHSRTVDEWRQIFKLWQESGLGKSLYCKQHGLAEGCFHRWYRRLEGPKRKEDVVSSFIPVDVRLPACVPFEITLQGGHRICIGDARWVDVALLLKQVLTCS